jgi:hypothetical protein
MSYYNKRYIFQIIQEYRKESKQELGILLNNPIFPFIISLILLTFASCKKLVSIPDPTSTITTSQVFSTNEQAISAMNGVYYNMVNNSSMGLLTGGMTIFTGLSSDELVVYNQNNSDAIQFNKNLLTPSNNILYLQVWRSPYSIIYQTNAIIDGLENSSTISDSLKQQLISQSKFVRAFIYLNLINLFGDVPFPITPDWRQNSSLKRIKISEIYEHITSDLINAQKTLTPDYSFNNGERTIPNKWAATSLLARLFLYRKDWKNAEEQASRVINNASLFGLVPNLGEVFAPNSLEAIWQLQQDKSASPFTATREGNSLIPRAGASFGPFAFLTTSLLNSFETLDNRRIDWVAEKTIAGTTYYYPYKYRIGLSQAIPDGTYSEYYTIFRLSEQFLIRAEARAMQSNLDGAIDDLNKIRIRANLPAFPDTLSQQQVLDAIIHERRIELFAEWGHRWIDLKRWGTAQEVLSTNKGSNVVFDALLYPIPISELQTAPNLAQNPGY